MVVPVMKYNQVLKIVYSHIGIFLFSAKLNDFVDEPFFLSAQVFEKVNHGPNHPIFQTAKLLQQQIIPPSRGQLFKFPP